MEGKPFYDAVLCSAEAAEDGASLGKQETVQGKERGAA